MQESYDYNKYLSISKEYIDSQQHPIKIIQEPFIPTVEREKEKPFVLIDCIYGFACNPCEFACKHGAIKKPSTSNVPQLDFNKCTGCMECVYQCPGLAIFGYSTKKDWVFLPIEFDMEAGNDVFFVDNNGSKIGEGQIEKILKKKNKTHIARCKIVELYNDANIKDVRGFIIKEVYPEKVELKQFDNEIDTETYICHCDDVKLDDIFKVIGNRKFISVDEVKHTTRLGMGACRGKRCIKRLKQTLYGYGISLVGEATPRGPLSNQVSLGEVYPHNAREITVTNLLGSGKIPIKVKSFIAGGGIGGSALFRYLAEAGLNPVMVNYGHGSSWRNIARH